jgi:hypothetical protein
MARPFRLCRTAILFNFPQKKRRILQMLSGTAVAGREQSTCFIRRLDGVSPHRQKFQSGQRAHRFDAEEVFDRGRLGNDPHGCCARVRHEHSMPLSVQLSG